MRNAWFTALREYRATVFTGAFVFGVLVFPAVMAVGVWFLAGAGVLSEKPKPLAGELALLDQTSSPGLVADRLAVRLSPPDRSAPQAPPPGAIQQLSGALPGAAAAYSLLTAEAPVDVQVRSVGAGSDPESHKSQVRSGGLLAFVQLPQDGLDGGLYELYTAADVSSKHQSELDRAVVESIVDARLRRAGHDPPSVRALFARPSGQRLAVTEDGEESSAGALRMVAPMVVVVILFGGVMFGVQYLLMSTVEEKSSRVMEVLLSSATPLALMVGKLIGYALVALTGIGIYGGVGAFAADRFGFLQLIPFEQLPWIACFGCLGYLMLGSVMAAIGSAVTDVREAQTLLGPIFGGVAMVFYVLMLNFQNPDSLFTRVASYVPLTAPVAMPLRLAQPTDRPALIETSLVFACCAACTAFVVWACSKVFRVGVFQYGKPPGFVALWRWLRTS